MFFLKSLRVKHCDEFANFFFLSIIVLTYEAQLLSFTLLSMTLVVWSDWPEEAMPASSLKDDEWKQSSLAHSLCDSGHFSDNLTPDRIAGYFQDFLTSYLSLKDHSLISITSHQDALSLIGRAANGFMLLEDFFTCLESLLPASDRPRTLAPLREYLSGAKNSLHNLFSSTYDHERLSMFIDTYNQIVSNFNNLVNTSYIKNILTTSIKKFNNNDQNAYQHTVDSLLFPLPYATVSQDTTLFDTLSSPA